MNFHTLPIHSIIVERADRQRRELTDIDILAESINRVGLIHPIVVTADDVLVAGERRLTACKALGHTAIVVRRLEDLSELELQVLELEENVRRVDLSWQDQVDAVRRYHELRASTEPSWSQERTADELGFSTSAISRMMVVADAIDRGVPRVTEADKFSTALSIAGREKERRQSSVIDSIALAPSPTEPSPPEPARKIPPLINEDFLEWSAAYCGPRFNLIHCDFPYGVGMDKSDQGAGGSFGTYADSADVYWRLLDGLAQAMTNVVHDSAHLIFWFSMDYFTETKERLTAMGWRVNPFPLIWMKNDNTGILPDPQRGPRRIYETAFFASRGDRKLATGSQGQGVVANAFAAPGRGKAIHMNEKPVTMLTHFMRLCCDEYSTVLDPTCGSGNALKAAQNLGAATVLGIERDPEFFDRAIDAYYGDENEE